MRCDAMLLVMCVCMCDIRINNELADEEFTWNVIFFFFFVKKIYLFRWGLFVVWFGVAVWCLFGCWWLLLSFFRFSYCSIYDLTWFEWHASTHFGLTRCWRHCGEQAIEQTNLITWLALTRSLARATSHTYLAGLLLEYTIAVFSIATRSESQAKNK